MVDIDRAQAGHCRKACGFESRLLIFRDLGECALPRSENEVVGKLAGIA